MYTCQFAGDKESGRCGTFSITSVLLKLLKVAPITTLKYSDLLLMIASGHHIPGVHLFLYILLVRELDLFLACNLQKKTCIAKADANRRNTSDKKIKIRSQLGFGISTRIPRPVPKGSKGHLTEEERSADDLIRGMRSLIHNCACASGTTRQQVSFFNGVRDIRISGGGFMADSRDYIANVIYSGTTIINNHCEPWLCLLCLLFSPLDSYTRSLQT